ncbi:MAG: hypothetical protein H6506_00090 [Calditrichaeota bacterium]|nr:hypothetical protein [Calditrichota bacterium]MCB9391038.1 hypothetical protein [Calditrichota bacterium]
MKSKNKKQKLQAGVSLLEVLVTVLIVTGGLVVVMSSFIGIQKSSRYVEHMETANSLLRLEMESLRSLPYASIDSESGSYGSSWNDQHDFRQERDVTDLGNVKRVKIKVYFDNDRHYAEATTIIAKL